MFCTHCGQSTPLNARYCHQCGRETNVWQSADSAPKRLFRLPRDKKIAGICSGIALYLNVDVTLIRIFTVALACFTGFIPGVIAYILAWIITPTQDAPVPAAPAPDIGFSEPRPSQPGV